MKLKKHFLVVPMMALTLALTACGDDKTRDVSTDSQLNVARFDWLRYEGEDPVYKNVPKNADQYFNPILTGFYPDPSITRAGDKFYIVTSTFTYFPGLPVFESTDLVNWTQIGNAIDRPDMLDFGGQDRNGLAISRGVFAPVIKEHAGIYYIANTCVDCRGNFILTARNPAGPWSDPVWLPDIGGIDPSLFFDDDGKVYLMNNDAPPEAEPLYSGHRAIWMREIDPVTFKSISEPVVLINGGVRREEKPIWIEGPSIYKKGDWYYLSAAEGGTAEEHSQVILRSQSVLGPYIAYEHNPIMTQRDMPKDRANPVTSIGHAAFVTDNSGQWWASLLGVRPYEGDFYNTGRETFLLPVTWKDGWPIILEPGVEMPYVLDKPDLPPSMPSRMPMSGNFTIQEDFSTEALDLYWLKIRSARTDWYRLNDGALELQARADGLGDFGHPSFIGRRQQHTYASASTRLAFNPQKLGDEAGLSAFQNDNFYYALGITRNEAGGRIVHVRKRAGRNDPAKGQLLATGSLKRDGQIVLKITAKGGAYDFSYKEEGRDWVMLYEDADGKTLSTRTAGGFVGTIFGMYAVTDQQ